MKALVAVVLSLVPAICSASNVSIGGVPLSVPSPQGFAPVTPQMAPLFELQKQFVTPGNEEFVAFIAEGKVAAALKGEIPELRRRFTVQTAKAIVSASVSSADFGKLKHVIKSQNQKILERIEKDLPELMAKVNKGIAEKYDVDLALRVSQMVPFPVHEESDHTLAYSALVKYTMNDATGKPFSYVGAVTTTFAHVNGKVLFLYSYAEETGLEWSREASKQWVAAIIAANPSDFESSVEDFLSSVVGPIDWGRVGAKAAVGAIFGLLIALIGGMVGWAKKRGTTGLRSSISLGFLHIPRNWASNGWKRLWVVFSLLLLMVVLGAIYADWPSRELVIERSLKEQQGSLDLYEESALRYFLMERKPIAQSEREFNAGDLKNPVRLSAAKLEQIGARIETLYAKTVGRVIALGLALWFLVSLGVYAAGWSVGWIREGFRKHVL